ncbi:hypothetical protein D515_01324 [Grimontia indica]|uniref:Uncharacterized protein n=1 Tax=Grimontia indica TaxID=1056512 RepID=R1IW87_9GAMM|nr:hypothetical protein D515_01324 [Grimontia indica]
MFAIISDLSLWLMINKSLGVNDDNDCCARAGDQRSRAQMKQS